MNKLVAPRQKSELLSNIEDLWHEAAAHSAESNNNEAQSTFQRISSLMQDAMNSSSDAANDKIAVDVMAPASPKEITEESSEEPLKAIDDAISEELAEQDDQSTIDALAEMVGIAADAPAHHPAETSAQEEETFEQIKSRMDDVAQLKPPQGDSYNSASPEYAFGNAFTNLVRHVVRDYIHNEVESVIRNAIKSELDAHFNTTQNSENDDENNDGAPL